VHEFRSATFKAQSLAHWMVFLAPLESVTARSIRCPAIADPNLLKRGAIVAGDDGRKHFAPAVRFKDEPSEPLYREPLLGEHTVKDLLS